MKTIDRYGCYNSGVEKIVLPDGMTSIGNSAFRSCSNLQSVKIGKGTVTFGKNVFRDCSALSAITFDGTICRFNGEDAFRSCNSLISVTITDLGAWCKSWFYTVSSTPLYYANNLLLLKGNETAEIKNVVIPNDVTEISSYLFSGCNSLESVTIGDGVTSIGYSAFPSSNLTSVTIFNKTPISIPSSAFSNRTNATLYVHGGCKSAYEVADYWEDFSEIIEFKKGDTFIAKTREGIDVTYEITDEENLYCQVGYTYDKKKGVRGAIDQSTSGAITIPSAVNGYTVRSVGDYAFSSCSNLTSIYIPDGVSYLGASAFNSCANAEIIRIPNSVVVNGSFGDRSFAGCNSLAAINIPEGIMSIGSLAFYGCRSLKSVVLPSTITTIYEQAFSGCSNLQEVVLPDGLKYIGTSAFTGCNLTSLTLPKSFTTSYGINNISYSGTQIGTIPSLKKVIVKKGVNSLYEVFKNCYNLETVVCYNEEPVNAYNCWHAASDYLYVPKGSKEKYETDNNWNSFAKIIEMEDGFDYDEMGDTFVVNGIIYKITNPEPREVKVGLYNKAIEKNTEGAITLSSSVKNPVNGKDYWMTSINNYAFSYCTKLTDITIARGVKEIGRSAFYGCSNLVSLSIPESVMSIGMDAFNFCDNLTNVKVFGATPVSIQEYTFSNQANATLYVPVGSKDAYEEAEYWKEFKEIVEFTPVESIEMPVAGIKTFSSTYMLDFSEVTGLKAYIASDFNPSTSELKLTRVNNVPASEGLLLKGEAGDYEIPYAATDMTYSNLLKGVVTPTLIAPTDGEYTNFILANGSHGIGFYTLSGNGTLAAGKAYLQLQNSSVSALDTRKIVLVFDDEQDDSQTTGITSVNTRTGLENGYYYSLQGCRMRNPQKGLYIVNGKKVMVK